MFETLNKAFMIGVGLAAMAKENVEDLAKDLVEKGKLSETEARSMAEDMLKKSAKARENLRAQVDKWLEQSLHKMHLPSKEDVDHLKDRIAKLEQALEK